MNLKESKEAWMGKSGGRKKKGEFYNYIIILPHKKLKKKRHFGLLLLIRLSLYRYHVRYRLTLSILKLQEKAHLFLKGSSSLNSGDDYQ